MIWWTVPEGPMDRARAYTPEEKEEIIKEDLLTKATAVRILLGFAYALKHHLRGEFGTDWDDMRDLIEFLPTVSEKTHMDKFESGLIHVSMAVFAQTSRSDIPNILKGVALTPRPPHSQLLSCAD